MQNTEWIIDKPKIPSEILNLEIDKDIVEILYKRGIKTKEDINKFLNSKLGDITNPEKFSDVKKASQKILKSIENKKKITIYGDYDVDGMTSTSLMVLALRNIGGDVDFYIPHRDEGYGLNNEAIEQIRNEGTNLMITVDCGISSIEEIKYANSIGLETIITDHHEINNELPEAHAIINPKRDDNITEFRSLAGVGVAFILLMYIYKKSNKLDEVYKYLDIVAIGTIADIVPLLEDNRIFVKDGLKQIKKTENLGLKILLKLLFEDKGKFISEDVGFKIAPVFNSAGRLEYAKTTVDLLISNSETESTLLARKLIKQNQNRREIEKEISNKVEEKIEKENLFEKNIIIAEGTDFHHGVIGIVASRVTEKYYKPSIILEVKDNGTAVASARSIEGFSIIKAINENKDIMEKYGGHDGAAGFTIKQENLDILKDRLYKYCEEKLNEASFIKKIYIDDELPFFKISYEFYNMISKLMPFGFGNRNPIFSIKNVSINNVRKIGKNKDHIMFNIEKDITIKNCVWFNKGELYSELNRNINFDVAFHLKSELYRSKFYTKIYVEDVKKSRNREFEYSIPFEIYNTNFPLETIIYSNIDIDEKKEITLNIDTNYKNIPIINGNKIIGFLNDNLTYIIKKHREYFGTEFEINYLDSFKYEENTHIRAIISKTFCFESLATSESGLFNDIKKFIIGDFEYNSLQKKVLSKIVKEKENILYVGDLKRGINSVILTCGVYYFYKNNKKLKLIKDDNTNFHEIFYTYFNVINEGDFKNKKLDEYTILYNVIPEKIEKGFVISQEKIKLDGFELICDDRRLPENIEIIDEEELKFIDSKNPIYSKKMPINSRKKIIDNLNKYKKVYATEDILAVL